LEEIKDYDEGSFSPNPANKEKKVKKEEKDLNINNNEKDVKAADENKAQETQEERDEKKKRVEEESIDGKKKESVEEKKKEEEGSNEEKKRMGKKSKEQISMQIEIPDREPEKQAPNAPRAKDEMKALVQDKKHKKNFSFNFDEKQAKEVKEKVDKPASADQTFDEEEEPKPIKKACKRMCAGEEEK